NTALRAAASRCIAENALEGVAKAAVRLISAIADDIIEGDTTPNRFECMAHAMRAAIRVKCHAIVLHEVAACPHRINAKPAHVRFRNAMIRRVLGEPKQRLHPVRRCSVRLQWRASFAGPVAGGERFTRTRKEFDVSRVGPSRRTGWQTEDTGRPDGGKE